MTHLESVLILEGTQEVETEDDYISAVQYIIDNGIHHHLQGSLQRRVEQMVNWGLCTYKTQND